MIIRPFRPSANKAINNWKTQSVTVVAFEAHIPLIASIDGIWLSAKLWERQVSKSEDERSERTWSATCCLQIETAAIKKEKVWKKIVPLVYSFKVNFVISLVVDCDRLSHITAQNSCDEFWSSDQKCLEIVVERCRAHFGRSFGVLALDVAVGQRLRCEKNAQPRICGAVWQVNVSAGRALREITSKHIAIRWIKLKKVFQI